MTGPSLAGRPRWWVAAASVVLLLVVGVLTWVVIQPDEYVVEPPSGGAPTAQPDLAAHALAELEVAVTTGDRAAAVALAPGSDPEATELLESVVDNAAALRVEDFTVRYVDETGAVDRQGHWQAAVDMTWRFEGFDEDPVHEEVLVGFVEDGEGVAITSFGGGDRRSPLWLSGPVEVHRDARVLVLAARSGEATSPAASYAGQAARAVVVVRRVLPRWPGRLVVEVPESAEGLDRVLAEDPGANANVAAVSASVDGTVTPVSPVHVFVNPELFGSLPPLGAQVVMSHEATHVATDAPLTSGMPLWLREGFADYVALRDVDLPVTTTASDIIAQVRRDGPPDALPGGSEFDKDSAHLKAAYESAWIACTLLAELGAEARLVRLYEQVRHGAVLGPTLRRLFHLTEAELTRRWQQRLAELSELGSGDA